MKRISDSQRYSILTNDLKHCIICGTPNVNLHEIFGGRNRQNSKDCGLVIPLCQQYHHNQYECKGIHFDKELRDKWHKIGQKKAMDYYNWDIDDFIKMFHINYL